MRPSIVKGFSLIEISISLIIIGILVAGVMTGQNIIRKGQINTVLKDFEKYNSATGVFQYKYGALPGDIMDAYARWLGDCSDTGVNDDTKCNGDGNAKIQPEVEGTGWICPDIEDCERFRFWQHMALAGVIEGSFSGIVGTATGINLPRGPMKDSAYQATIIDTIAPGVYIRKNGFIFINPAYDGAGAILSAEETMNIDKKVDDGRPYKGKILGGNGSNTTGCVSGTTADNAIYDLSSEGAQCGLIQLMMVSQ